MKADTLDDLIEIDDPEIDPARIMEQIRERVRLRREEMGYPRRRFPSFGAAAYPGEPAGEDYDEDLYHHLRRANDLYHEIALEPSLAASPATRVPILGSIWKRIRREAHNLVLYYVRALARRQVVVNRHLVSTLNRLVLQLQQQEEELRELRREVEQSSSARLRSRSDTEPG
jgi:hypothetical protein